MRTPVSHLQTDVSESKPEPPSPPKRVRNGYKKLLALLRYQIRRRFYINCSLLRTLTLAFIPAVIICNVIRVWRIVACDFRNGE